MGRLQEAMLTLVGESQCAHVIIGHEWALECLFSLSWVERRAEADSSMA